MRDIWEESQVRIIGIGAGSAGPVLAGPPFGDLMKFIIDVLKNGTCLLQPDHFKSLLRPCMMHTNMQRLAESQTFTCTRTSQSSYLPRQDKFLCCVIATHLFITSLNFSTCCMHGLLTGSKQCHEPCLCVDPFPDLAWE